LKYQGDYWNGACGYPTSRGQICGVRLRKGAIWCARHGGSEPDERAKAKARWEKHRRAVQARKVLNAMERDRTELEEIRLREAQRLFLRTLRGEVGDYAID